MIAREIEIWKETRRVIEREVTPELVEQIVDDIRHELHRVRPGSLTAQRCAKAYVEITSTYERVGLTWVRRQGVPPALADKLIQLGFGEAIYGRGREWLDKE